MRMPKFFRSRRPKHVATHQAPSAQDMLTAYAWNLTLNQWQGMTDFERQECRRNITVAPRFQS